MKTVSMFGKLIHAMNRRQGVLGEEATCIIERHSARALLMA